MKKNLILLGLLLSTFYFGQVGINTTSPSATLDIVSKGLDGTTKALEINNSATTPKEMVTVLDNNNFGIGVSNPLYNLEIGDFLNNGSYFSLSQTGSNANGQSSLTYFTKRDNSNSLTNATSKGWKWFALSDAYTTNPALANSLYLEGWNNGVRTQNVLVANPNGNVGFGTPQPTAKVHINTSAGVGTGFRLVDGSQGAGKVLVSDANGNASWGDGESAQYLSQKANITSDVVMSKAPSSPIAISGLDGFTAAKTGKYLVIYHSFIVGSTSVASDEEFNYYLYIFKNGVSVTNPETYSYLGAPNQYFAQATTSIIDIAAGDVITYGFTEAMGSTKNLTFKPAYNARNIVEVTYLGK